jgi:alginate O-acetyltransferase complex protein AlgI
LNYNTFSFWLFFLGVFVVYWRLAHRGQNRLMLAASYVFYSWWDYRFLFLILISTVIDYIGGLGVANQQLPRDRLRRLGALLVASSVLLTSGIRYGALWDALIHGDGTVADALPQTARAFLVPLGTLIAVIAYGVALPRLYAQPEARRRKLFLAISMVANLVILAFFKYFDFFVSSLLDVFGTFGWYPDVGLMHIILPAGISFYTFQAMSYTIDIYRGETEPTTDFGDFALFVCFFPHLVAGPIMRAHTLLPQVLQPRKWSTSDASEGVVLILIGLFKKLVIADNLAVVANAVFFRFEDGTASGLTGTEVLIGIYAFAFQIYGDFSGYSAIARGISKLFGYELVINFDTPYLAQSPSDFWKRWHISLSSWLRDYLYIPLGGNRGGLHMMYRNLTLTMLLGGLWHGASWTFVAWGLYHGIILVAFRMLGVRDTVPPGHALRAALRTFLMFHLTCLGWLLFRAESFGTIVDALHLMATSFEVTSWSISAIVTIAFLAAPLFFLEVFTRGERKLDRLLGSPIPVRFAVYGYVMLMILLFHAEQASEFIYFQF